jgi:hypothetical protein
LDRSPQGGESMQNRMKRIAASFGWLAARGRFA